MPAKSHTSAAALLNSRPGDATLTVARAAQILGVHPNTVRAWSDAGRLRYFRMNARGDRRYRMADLQRFLVAAESGPAPAANLRPVRARRTAARVVAARDAVADLPAGLDLLAELADITAHATSLEAAFDIACRRIRGATGAALVGVWERRPGGLVPRAAEVEGSGTTATRSVPPGRNVLTVALESNEPIHARPGVPGPRTVLGIGTDELAVAIPGADDPWGVLVLAGAVTLGPDDGKRLAVAIARILGVLVHGSAMTELANGRLRRSEALRRVATDLASRLDVGDVLRDLGDHTRVLFGADRVAVVLRDAHGRVSAPSSSGFSDEYLETARLLEEARDGRHDIPSRRPAVILGPDAPRSSSPLRAAAIQAGVATLLVAPLIDGHELHGVLHLAHDRPYRWRDADINAAEALAGDAAIAVRSARTFGRMATWAAQLQSIQRLGARLSGLLSVRQIGHAIANELRLLIDYHNVRVYRVVDDELVPVAMLGQVGEYVDETPDQLKTQIGAGLTGWVAQYRVPQLIDNAAADPRARTIPGTDADLDESMLLAPMVHEGSCLGVLVLSKLGLRQFTEDDLRLLVIYASFASQAMANADATEQLHAQSGALERQLRAQRELLRITESILTTLDPRAVLEQITDRLGTLIASDNIAIEVVDRSTGLLVPLTARGAHAETYLSALSPGESGLANWVVAHNEPVLIQNQRDDPRVSHGVNRPVDGSLIVVPLLGPDGALGVLTLERLGATAMFEEQDFELVKLFAAQVSIALRNAESFQAAEVRARTDDLTGLLNHGTFKERLERSVASREPFGLVMIDLDTFKLVNDSMGHQAGDRLLREIAAVIAGAARETDAVFRYGGDEFAVILPRSDPAGLALAAERVRAAVAGVGNHWDTGGVPVSTSIGTASFPTDGRDAEAVLLAADRACFVAKRRGRGRVATAADGLVLAGEFQLSEPTPVDPPTVATA